MSPSAVALDIFFKSGAALSNLISTVEAPQAITIAPLTSPRPPPSTAPTHWSPRALHHHHQLHLPSLKSCSAPPKHCHHVPNRFGESLKNSIASQCVLPPELSSPLLISCFFHRAPRSTPSLSPPTATPSPSNSASSVEFPVTPSTPLGLLFDVLPLAPLPFPRDSQQHHCCCSQVCATILCSPLAIFVNHWTSCLCHRVHLVILSTLHPTTCAVVTPSAGEPSGPSAAASSVPHHRHVITTLCHITARPCHLVDTSSLSSTTWHTKPNPVSLSFTCGPCISGQP